MEFGISAVRGGNVEFFAGLVIKEDAVKRMGGQKNRGVFLVHDKSIALIGTFGFFGKICHIAVLFAGNGFKTGYFTVTVKQDWSGDLGPDCGNFVGRTIKAPEDRTAIGTGENGQGISGFQGVNTFLDREERGFFCTFGGIVSRRGNEILFCPQGHHC